MQDIDMLRRAGCSSGAGEGEAAGAAGLGGEDVMGTNVQEVMVVGPGLASLMAKVHGLLVQFPDNAVLQVRGCFSLPTVCTLRVA